MYTIGNSLISAKNSKILAFKDQNFTKYINWNQNNTFDVRPTYKFQNSIIYNSK